MKKLLILLLAAVLLCGCAGERGEKPPEDTTSKPNSTNYPSCIRPIESASDDKDATQSYRQQHLVSEAAYWFMRLNAVAVTWGEPITGDNEDGDDPIKIRVTYDEIYYSSFRMHNFPFEDTHTTASNAWIRAMLGDYITVPKKTLNRFPAGKKQLVFVERGVYGVFLNAREDENGKMFFLKPMFDIVDGKILFPDDFEEYYISFWTKIINQHSKWLGDLYPLFEDGMLLSDFGPYLDRVMSYGN